VNQHLYTHTHTHTHTQQSSAETAANSFVFLLNSGEELHYGVCVYSNELVSVRDISRDRASE